MDILVAHKSDLQIRFPPLSPPAGHCHWVTIIFGACEYTGRESERCITLITAIALKPCLPVGVQLTMIWSQLWAHVALQFASSSDSRSAWSLVESVFWGPSDLKYSEVVTLILCSYRASAFIFGPHPQTFRLSRSLENNKSCAGSLGMTWHGNWAVEKYSRGTSLIHPLYGRCSWAQSRMQSDCRQVKR